MNAGRRPLDGVFLPRLAGLADERFTGARARAAALFEPHTALAGRLARAALMNGLGPLPLPSAISSMERPEIATQHPVRAGRIPSLKNTVDFQAKIVMQARGCMLLNDKTQAFRSLDRLGAARLVRLFKVPLGLVAGEQFLDHRPLRSLLEQKADAHVKVPVQEFARRRQSCSRWRPVRSTACHAGPSGNMSRNGMASVAC